MNFNSRQTEYKKPFGAVKCGEKVTFNFPIASWVPVDRVIFYIRLLDDIIPYEMEYKESRDGHNIYSVSVKLEKAGIYYYRFEMHNRDGVWYYGRGENSESVCGEYLPEWQLTVTKNYYKTPDFAKGGIIYHIFADRFNRAHGIKTERQYRLHESWNDDVEVVSPDGKYYADDFFGGNFRGIEEKIPYLKELGVSIIYLSPIFKSFSNHRYDTGDYLTLDPLLGTEADFKSLIDACHKNGIAIILDGVFNHSGSDSIYFNKFGRYNSVGAYQSKESPYFDWYYFKKYPTEYACWWGCDNVPDLNKSNEGYRHLIFGVGGVIEKWQGMGIDGWRLDVVDELPIDFTYRLCETIKRCNKNALIIGEVWEDASTKVSYSELRPYLLGDQLDGTMNYPFMNAIIGLVRDKKVKEFKETIMSILENYPKETIDCVMNSLSTHDTVRIINSFATERGNGWSKERKRDYHIPEDEYIGAKSLLKVASAIQFTLPGIPSIFYGDEVGLQGFEDPVNRRPFPWDNMDEELLSHYRKLGAIRASNTDAFKGGFEFIDNDNGLVIFKRLASKNIFVIVNVLKDATYTFEENAINLYDNILYTKGQSVEIKENSFLIFKNQ